jgi:hypothetical protein
MTTNHTPAPWTTAPCSHGGLILRRGSGLTDHEQPFLQIMPEADALLIAAAPDLLSAAKALLGGGFDREDSERADAFFEMLAQAVAKAEGN